MDFHQLKTFVIVAREGSITRASERLYLSQPAVSAHIKAVEDGLGVSLFDRTPRGMTLTAAGQRLLIKAEQTLRSRQELLEEAATLAGKLTGKLRLGVGGTASTEALGRLLTTLADRFPEVELALTHGTSSETLEGLRRGTLDAGFYNEAADPPADLATTEIARFGIHLVAPSALGLRPTEEASLDWNALAALPWISPTSSTCCGRAAEALFERHAIRPRRMIHIDREAVTRTLIAGNVGLGMLHTDTAEAAQRSGEATILCRARSARALFARLASREREPLLEAVTAIVARSPPF